MKKIKLSDYVALRLKNHYKINRIFMVTGGGAIHLNQSFGEHLEYVCCHHEQAISMAAEGYSRMNNTLSVVNVTTGPGGVNTLNGVFGQWTDSVPVLYLSGQVKRETLMKTYPNFKGRQIGDQEVDIVAMVKPITKYAVCVTDEKSIKYHLDKAIHIATTGRSGPVWLDIPSDVQLATIDEDDLTEFIPQKEDVPTYDSMSTVIPKLIEMLNKAKKPLIVAGGGIHNAKANHLLKQLADVTKIPIACSFHGIDLLAKEHPSYLGLIGVHANRASNYAVQECDLLLTIGSRNDIRHVTYNFRDFAPKATKVVVDIDEEELKKPTITPDFPIHSDAKVFLEALVSNIGKVKADYSKWYAWARKMFLKYPNVPTDVPSEGIHPYVFTSRLLEKCDGEDALIATDGTCYNSILQAGYSNKGTRFFSNSGNASMGYGLPAAIGGAFAILDRKKGKQVFCLEGDGSMQMNIQELQTIIHYKLPIKIIYFNNGGYVCIRQTQKNFFHKNGYEGYVGCGPESGVSFPDMKKVSEAYGYKHVLLKNPKDLDKTLDEVIASKEQIFLELILSEYDTVPKIKAKILDDGRVVSVPMDDMFPFLSDEEKRENKYVD